jgi:hypothetical protein
LDGNCSLFANADEVNFIFVYFKLIFYERRTTGLPLAPS